MIVKGRLIDIPPRTTDKIILSGLASYLQEKDYNVRLDGNSIRFWRQLPHRQKSFSFLKGRASLAKNNIIHWEFDNFGLIALIISVFIVVIGLTILYEGTTVIAIWSIVLLSLISFGIHKAILNGFVNDSMDGITTILIRKR